MKVATRIFLFAAVLILPVLQLWQYRDLPRFGDYHDDSLYYVSAKSLAAGDYRIESLPGTPYQTKYPPLYPALLSIAWLVEPRFPDNLPIAALLSWLAMPLLVGFAWFLYRREGVSEPLAWIFAALLAVNPYYAIFSLTLLSELLFTAFLLGLLLLLHRAGDRAGWYVAAGLIAGLAFLTRSMSIVLLITVPVGLWLNGRARQSIWFAAGMLPVVGTWTLWSGAHRMATNEAALVYYTDYVRYHFLNVGLSNLHLVVWKNIDTLLWGMGRLLIPDVAGNLFTKIITQVAAVGMLIGCWKLWRQGKYRQYLLFTAVLLLMLAFWHFPPNERFVLPLLPVLLAGLYEEGRGFVAMLQAGFRHAQRDQRIAARLMAAVASLLVVFAVAMQAFVLFRVIPESMAFHRSHRADKLAAYRWMSDHLPAGTPVMYYRDPVLYLHTGRPSQTLPMPTHLWYADDFEGKVDLYRKLDVYARRNTLEYLFQTDDDLTLEMSEKERLAIEKVIATHPALEKVFEQGIARVYRLKQPDVQVSQRSQ